MPGRPSHVLLSCLALACAFACAGASSVQGASSSSSTVGVTVLSATQLDTTGCAPNTAGVTLFGSVTAGSSTVTSADCVIAFGSSNDTSMLRIAQEDGAGRALVHDGWTQQLASGSGLMHDVSAQDDQNAIAVGTVGRIFRTTNGGTTWTPTALGGASLYGVHQFDSTHAWAVGASATIWKTVDGSTWTSSSSGVAGAANIWNVASTAANNAWVVASSGDIRATFDGGATWALQANPGQQLLDIVAVSATELFAVGGNGTILHTINSGTTWTAQTSGTGTYLRSVDAADANNLWVTGSNGVVLHTTNGGVTWSPQASGTTTDLDRVAAVTATRAFAVGATGLLRQTDDGGATWTAGTIATTEDLGGVDYANGRAWIVGDHATVFASPDVDVPDYATGVDDWDQGSNGAFGACLRAQSGTGATAGWPVDGNATCTTNDTDPWNGIPTTPGAAGALVMRGTSTMATDLVARLRFGVRALNTTRAGDYRARLTFSVIAPNA
ncbi:MAG: hypothetical protein JWN72_300 [Thermoleophilia bacterium]|nr:hypothetical protein [Thermoleophilia bacterium]